MPDRLAQGSAWLARQQRTHCATQVYYSRGSSAIRVPATLGRSTFDTTDVNGFTTRTETEDFIVSVSLLVIDGLATLPAVNDRVIVGDPGEGEVFQVVSPGGGKPFAYTDAHRNQFRIHTQRVGRQPPTPE